MRNRTYKKYLSSLLVFALIFSLFLPVSGQAAGNSVKNQLSSEALSQMKAIIAAQKAAEANGPVLHPDLQGLSGDEEVSVIVQLSEPPVAFAKGLKKIAGKSFSKTEEKNVEQKVTGQQKKFENALKSKGISAKKRFQYNYAFNGLAIKVKASQVKKLLTLPEVQLVEPDLEVHALGEPAQEGTYSPDALNSNNHLDIPSVWDLGFEGQNVKVAVLDTGIDYNHPEFEGVYKGGYNFVSHATGYERPRADNDPYETSPKDRPANRAEIDSKGNTFYTEHGTHVAGTIAAQGKNPYSIKGLAPKVELYAYRVLGAYGSGATSGIIAAIDKAAAEKMDVINMSLGGSSNSQTASDAIAVNNAALAGTLSVVATGNSGPNRGTIGNPASAAFALSVGNSTIKEEAMKADVNVTVEGSAANKYNLNLMGWKFGTQPGQLLNGTYEVVAIPGVGKETDYAGIDARGKVALVARGEIAFVDKIDAAKKAGAVSIIVHNNGGTNGNGPANVFLGDSFKFIPTFDMSTTDGTALRTALAGKKGTVTFNNFATSVSAGDEINSSSSRGPSTPTFDIKPDVSAPGTNIMSSVPAYGKDFPDADYSESYERFTGTSMATPHVAAIAALLKSQHPNWTPFDLKVAISNTAKQLDTGKYDVFSQGPGRVQPLKAVTTEALAYALDKTSFSGRTYDNTKGTITFGNVPTSTLAASTITKDVVVKNLSGNPSDYSVSVQVTKAAGGTLAAANVTVDQSSFTLTDEKTLKVTLNVPKGSGSSGNELLGYVKLTNGKTNLILPFAASFAPPTGLKAFSIDSYHISPNGDGKLDSTTVRYEFHDRQYTTYLELWDAQNQEGGYYKDGYLGYLVAANSTTVGPKTVQFNGQITAWGSGAKTQAPDGVYTLDLTTYNLLGTALVTANWLGPVFVKSTLSKIMVEDSYNFSGSNYTLKGSLDDSYVKFGPVVEEVFGETYDVNDYLKTKYELYNSNGDLTGSGPVSLLQNGGFDLDLSGLELGDNKLKIIVDDAAQNHAEKEITLTRIDTAAPSTDVTVSGTEGNNGWYTSDVSVDFNAADDESGVKGIEYKVNGGAWTAYTGSVKLTMDGVYNVQFRGEDNAGNVEEAKSVEVKIDKTAPALKVSVDKSLLSPPNNKFVNIKADLNYSDSMSGVESVVLESITVNDKKYTGDGIKDADFGTQDVEFSLRASKNSDDSTRIYTINYLVKDKAGNTTKAATTVTVPKNQSGK
ncbi:S8 family serine peptidase [Bacillus sp. B-jedd]|uniref:S8 family serine peptidase n=1 Tax=Bacillus sp. B-jedd TaxID=1476857 RepID=UPI0005156FCA|nr:S8 family serine peptidase [Bacillus sp. B-jedd]CEG28478.1 subtilisin-like serine protease [Bacillus sp. B-jedd]